MATCGLDEVVRIWGPGHLKGGYGSTEGDLLASRCGNIATGSESDYVSSDFSNDEVGGSVFGGQDVEMQAGL